MRKDGADPEELKPLPCRSWGCEYCAPNRKRQLMAQAAAGQPNKLLTLTVNVSTGTSSGERRDMLHAAWKKLVKRINRQFALRPDRRWPLVRAARSPAQATRVLSITTKTLQAEFKSLPYFAFLERTKRGEPHLHILLRCPYIPQDWLSEQMFDLLGSPIVWIEEIKGSKHAVAYVTKYVTKAPAQWGNRKRYWASRNWSLEDASSKEQTQREKFPVTIERVSWADLSTRRALEGWTIEQLDDGWVRHWRPGASARWRPT